MEDLLFKAKTLQAQWREAAAKIALSELESKRAKLAEKISAADFWQSNPKAREIAQEEAGLTQRIKPWQALKRDIDELLELADMKDSAMHSDLESHLQRLEGGLEELRGQLRFSGPYDDHNVIIAIHAGAGGTDAQDWAQMLLRMYVRWAEKKRLQLQTLDQSSGEEAGIKSAVLQISGGEFLHGKLSGEHGVHRLVRLSPFNADHLRQTSFAKVEVQPLINKPSEVELNEKDLKIDVFRAGGHGGQSVNTTDSAVRITHLPTGVSVAIQNERSQLQNKETALNILRSKLVQLSLEQHAENLSELKGPNQSAEWGHQVRNYVLHPYKQVKDLRSGYESSEVEKVLDGDLDPLIDAWLATK